MSLISREYECLLHVYAKRNITHAAKKLGMQQSGLSKLLMRIESELGKKLFARKKDGLLPTPFVEKLVRDILETQDQWNAKYRLLLEEENKVEGNFKMGCHRVLAANYLASSYVELRQKFPDLNLDIILKASVEVTQEVIDGHIDFGVVANPVYHPDLVMRRIGREYVALWSHGKLSEGGVIYFNPEMMQIHRVLAQLKKFRLVSIPDYQLIHTLLLEKPLQGAVMPSFFVLQPAGLEQISKPYYWTDVCLIYRADIAKTLAVREIVKAIARKRG